MAYEKALSLITGGGGSIVADVVNNSDTGDQEIHVSKETMKNVFFARTTQMNAFAYLYKQSEAETRVTFTDGEEPTIFYWNGTFWTDNAESEDTGGKQ